jgi:Ca2+-binding EF-hand superfamily protein
MSLTRAGLITLGLALTTGVAWAQRPTSVDLLATMDANADGSISRPEAQAARALLFDRMDTDGDGALSREERDAVRSNRGAAQLVNGADANNDGVISRAEVMARPYRIFDIFDRNRDDVLGPSELNAIRTMRPG